MENKGCSCSLGIGLCASNPQQRQKYCRVPHRTFDIDQVFEMSSSIDEDFVNMLLKLHIYKCEGIFDWLSDC